MVALLGNLQQGLTFIVSAPAGTGKTTLVSRLTEEFPCIIQSVSCTTRQRREGEQAGIDYHFLSEADFKKRISDGDFLEHAKVFGHYYGTSKHFVLEQQSMGKHVVLVIDTQGALQVMQQLPAISIFITPPSQDELRQRLYKRQTETPQDAEARLAWSEKEIQMAFHYDYQIVNEDLEVAYQALKSIFIAEEHRSIRKALLSSY